MAPSWLDEDGSLFRIQQNNRATLRKMQKADQNNERLYGSRKNRKPNTFRAKQNF